MHDPDCSTEVAVIGAGPAGCAAALRLAQLGHEVIVVERGGSGRPAVVESAATSIDAPLQVLGLLGAVQSAGFLRPRGAWVQWDGDAPVGGDGAAGYQLVRERFDAVLHAALRQAGVRRLTARARLPRRGPDGRWCINLHDGRELGADAVVLATGRAGAAPLPGAVPTAALCGVWPRAATPDARGRVQAGAQAWAWAAPADDGRVAAALFVDPRRLAGLDDAARAALLHSELARLDLLAGLLPLQGAGPLRLRCADATPRLAAMPAEPGLVRAGEAALSLDPLSSQGVATALRSGLQAAAALHTMLRRPQHSTLAQAFHAEQSRRDARRHARWCGGFHAAAARRFGTDFWCQRAKQAATGDAPIAHPPWPDLAQPLGLHADARHGRTAMLDGDWVVEAPALLHPALEAPVGWVQGLPVARLLQAIEAGASTGELLRRWAALLGDAAAVALLRDWWRQGVLAEARPPLDAPRPGA